MARPRFLYRISLTTKMVLLTVIVGIVAWSALDYFQTRTVKGIFLSQLKERLNREAQEDRIRFDNYIKAHHQSVRLMAAQKRLIDYVSGQGWTDTSDVLFHKRPPGWLPKPSVMRSFVQIRYALLLDAAGRAIEVYQGMPEAPPEALLYPTVLLRQLSHNQAFMTYVDSAAFLITSESIRDARGRLLASLMLASPLDEDFLIASKGPYHGGIFAQLTFALVTGEKPRILVSTNPALLPAGTLFEDLEGRYLVTGKSLFDYGASDLLLGFASFISLEEVGLLIGSEISRNRVQRAVTAFILILFFALIMYWITKRIGRLTRRVSDFSESALGGKAEAAGRGDQINVLDERFQRLTEEVVSSSKELETRVEQRTEELREERDKSQKYLDVAGVMFVVIDADEKVGLINKKGCEILDFAEKDVIGKNWFDNFMPERSRDKARSAFGTLMAGEVEPVEYFENPVLTAKGGEKVIAWHNTVLRDEKENVLGILSSGEDITERKRAEEERNSLISTLNTLVDHMPEGVVLLDAENRVAHANPVGEEHVKALAKAVVGDVLADIAGRPVRELLVSPPQVMWHDIEMEGRIFEVAGRPIDHRGIVFVIRDVTEKRAVGQRIQLHERLASVGQLAAGIAHDFNNILTVIRGYAEMLQETEMPPEAREQLNMIQHSGQRATALINQILDFSRKTVGELKVIDLKPFVKEFSKFIRSAIPENISIALDYAPGEYIVWADTAKMQQVLANLAVNARDAMPGGGEMKIGISHMGLKPKEKPPFPDMPAGEWVVLTVADTGTGIPPEILPRIFEPFFTTKEAGKGVGLGLSQVYGIVKQHSGHIDVKSEAGEGSSFAVYLPAAVEPAEEPAPKAETAIPRGRGETILVAEDEKAVLDFLKKILDGLGYKLVTAADGVRALRAFEVRQEEIGLVITDLVMPEMGGIELSKEIKKKNPSIKVIALSGYPLADKKEFLEAGFDEFIQKPFRVRTIAQAVRKALGK
jgi:PAS domain S-box-containing protein